MASLNDVALDNLATDEDRDNGSADTLRADADDASLVRFVNKVLLDTIQRGASDIHFEPYEQSYRVRQRQDGVLTEVASPPAAIGMRISARFKVMARIDLAERRLPRMAASGST